MRILAGLFFSAILGLAAVESPRQQIVYARVSPNPGGLNLFIAAADGAGERPLLPDRTWTTTRHSRQTRTASSSHRSGPAPLTCFA
jgi:hypothetical protein